MTYSYEPLHMAEQKQGKQLKPTYSSSVRIRNVGMRTCRKRWMIGRGGERGSGISVLIAWQDDDEMMNDFKKNWILSVRARRFIHLIDLSVLLWFYIKIPSLMSITPIQAFLQVYNVWQLVYMIQWFFFSFLLWHKMWLNN